MTKSAVPSASHYLQPSFNPSTTLFPKAGWPVAIHKATRLSLDTLLSASRAYLSHRLFDHLSDARTPQDTESSPSAAVTGHLGAPCLSKDLIPLQPQDSVRALLHNFCTGAVGHQEACRDTHPAPPTCNKTLSGT